MNETTPTPGRPDRTDGTAPASSAHEPAAARPDGQPVSSTGGREDTAPLPPYAAQPQGQDPAQPPGQGARDQESHAEGTQTQGGSTQGSQTQGGSSYGQSYAGHTAYGPNPYGQAYSPSPQPGSYAGSYSGGFGGPPTDQGRTTGTDSGRPRRRSAAGVAALALVAGLLGGGVGAAATDYFGHDQPGSSSTALDEPAARSQNAASAPVGSVQQVADKVLPSVVSITIATSQGTGNGSGIVLSDDGLILTNNHVAAAGSQGGRLSVTFNDGKTVKASVVGTDPTTDLAVIRANRKSGLHPAQLGRSSDLSVGQNVVAIGSPLGLSGTVTSGIVSAKNRPVRSSDSGSDQSSSNTVIDAIQTDAAINPGNSGGALVNMAGQVVGINSAIATLGSSMGGQSGSIGVGFAIPIDEARPIAKELIANGRAEHAQLAVSVTATSGNDGVGNGASLQAVNAGGAADKAGLRKGDVITKVDDRQISDPDSLIAAVRSYRPGDKVTVTYVRGGTSKTVDVTLGTDGGKTPQPQQNQQQDQNNQAPGDQGNGQDNGQGNGLPFPWSR
ncbi:putative serine protease PepD [Actinopolymorpha cephalotaxi]|uniref:Serine protease PepD n=1 Tax=Actinopolymorpha cephalotaxi TaxID=504797 RepID=A0A1I2TK20_9ACTN|nr:trypsin-like peptidase domain-containing protein [Actinopolymorpha cephalotaxi]NYH83068.1 putative serine protease PepD [Actinopolymorpha cephalotaxi]SFG63737.1 putative serine protease PepD [Actinopolymorpha cephalotaxi]